MPIYEYDCQKCHERTEVIQGFSDPPLKICPHCGTEYETSARFCPNDGTPLTAEAIAPRHYDEVDLTAAVAVVLGASGSVITDALGPYEVFARSPEFFVYTVSAGPAAMLSGGLAVVPDYSLGDVDAGTAPDPDVVVIPAVLSPAGSKERPLREWLARRAGQPGP